MTDNIIKIPSPVSGGLILSYKCSAVCRHCMYLCSPKWSADWISEKYLERGLSQLGGRIVPSPYGADNVSLSHGLHFSGGEPFLNFDLLLQAVEISTEYGIPSTFVETNCYWCNDDESTHEKLELLKSAGLKGIMISVNPYYAEYVPFERTERCVRISQKIFAPQNVMIYQMEYYRLFKALGIKDKISVEDFIALSQNENLMGNVEMFLMGRATYKLKEFYTGYPADPFLNMPCQPPFFRNWHNHFDNYGNFMPGFCGGLSLGSWFNLDTLLKNGINLDEYPVLKYLISSDMRGLLQFATDLGYTESEQYYLSKCGLCLDIRKYLIDKGDFKELSPKEFYNNY